MNAGAKRVGLAYLLFLRIVALFMLAMAIQYWMRLTGVFSGPDMRFDLMAQHWRLASASLAVLAPVAALGLWGQLPWGIVVWLLVVAVELTMFAGFPELFGADLPRVAFHAGCLTLFVGFRLAMRFMPNKK